MYLRIACSLIRMRVLTSAFVAAFVTFSVSGYAIAQTGAAEKPTRPNVLVISIDDLNDWVGCLGGHPQVQTPNMDALAARGTVFTNAHCQSPLCNSSRTSVMTGLRPTTTGVYGLAPWFRTIEQYSDWTTLPQYFQKNGYETITCGKIYHDAYPPRDVRGTGVEFDEWGYHGSGGKPRPEKRIINLANLADEGHWHPLMDWGVFPEFDHQQDDYKVATWAAEKLDALADQPRDKPFMLYCGFRRPHVPCFAPQKWFDLYPEETLQMPPMQAGDRDDTPMFSWYLHWKLPEPRLSWLRKAGEDKSLVRAYLASTSFVDDQVGRVLAALEENDLAENTVVVLWSDHGYHLGEKEISGKNTLWDRSTRVPLIISGPTLKTGRRCSQPAELLDIYPTLVDVCGLPERDGLEGHSLLPQLENANTARQWPAITSHNQGNHTVRTQRWRYIRYADGSEELYDMANDPNEFTNLAATSEFAETKNSLAKWLPKIDRPLAEGSRHRILTWDGETAVWEGEVIDPNKLER